MKREKVRLEELQGMPYQDYLLTPEWQETQNAALKRVGNRCQVCNAENVKPSAYHRTCENLGCEQEEDIVVLCEACAEHLYRIGKLAQSEGTFEGPEEEERYPGFSITKKAAVFVPSAVIGLGLPALLHAPLPAEIGGIVIAILLAANSPKIYGEMKDSLPIPLVELLDGMEERKRAKASIGEWNAWDRLLGRHRNENAVSQAGEEESTDSLYSTDDQQDYLDLGPTLQPHADNMLSGRKVILGVSGSGKTNTMNVYCEELAKLKPAPAIILFDTDDENRALCNRKYLPNPVWLDRSKGLNTKNAFATAQNILEHRYQCVVNLQSFEDEEAAWIMINMVKGVKAWQEAREVRIPCEVILDEASVWLPQSPRESMLSSILIDDPDMPSDEDEEVADQLIGKDKVAKDKASRKITLLTLLQRTFFTVARRGRRRGIGFTLAAQRIAEIDKRALQGSWMFLMRQTQPADFREYQKYKITPEEAMRLLDGEAFVFAPGKPRERHRLRQSVSPHGGVTPGMKALRGQSKHEQQTTQTPMPEPEQTTDRATTEHSHRREVPRRSDEAATARHPGAGLPKILKEALNAYVPGMTYRELGAKFGYNDGEAREIWLELKRRGLLHTGTGTMESVEVQPHTDTQRTSTVRTLYSVPTTPPTQMEELKPRPIDPADLAKAFVLWQAGAASVRKLEAAAKEAKYGWSNGKVRLLIEEMENRHLIPKREAGVV